MVDSSVQGMRSWMGMATSAGGVELDKRARKVDDFSKGSSNAQIFDVDLSFRERVISAGGAAFVSAVIVNPLDVAKTRLQAQAAGVPYDGFGRMGSFEASTMEYKHLKPSVCAPVGTQPTCSPNYTHYKGTLDVFYKVARQEGFSRLWRGTNASLALAIPSVGLYMPLYDIFRNYLEDLTRQNTPSITTYIPLVAGSVARSIACITCYPLELARTRMQAYTHSQTMGEKPPGVWKTLIGAVSPFRSANNHQYFQSYRILWTGIGAQLARDVPFSAVCWSSLEPLRRRFLSWTGDEGTVYSILGANFCAGFVAGSLAAAATCPLDVARTRHQIERDPARALTMTTRYTLMEIWREGGLRGLFVGGGPRLARGGPSVGIVVSFYEVVKYAMQYKPPCGS